MPDISGDPTIPMQVLWLLAQPLVYPNSSVGQETGASRSFWSYSDYSTLI
jgi:hypothetical protein